MSYGDDDVKMWAERFSMFTRIQVANKITGSQQTHVVNLSGPLVNISPDAPGAGFLAAIGSAYQQQRTLSREHLLTDARALLKFVESERDLLHYRYTITGTTGMLLIPFHIDGVPHDFRTGSGECYLLQLDSKGDGVSRIDIRRANRIQTDDFGELKVSRRKISFALPVCLAQCIDFLEAVADQEVSLYSYDTLPSLRTILDNYTDGCGGDDWAIEEISRRGNEGRAELLDAITNSRYHKRCGAIVQLLLLCFPGDDTREAVMNTLAQLPDEGGNELQMLVKAFTPHNRPPT